MASFLKAVVGNTAPQYQWQATRDDGSVVDLTSTVVTVKFFKGNTQMNPTAGHDACVVVGNPLEGIFGWTPKAGDLPVKGKYKGDVKVTYTDATFETLFNNALLNVRKLLGN